MPETSVSGVDGRLKRKKKIPFLPWYVWTGVNIGFHSILDCRCQEERRRYLIWCCQRHGHLSRETTWSFLPLAPASLHLCWRSNPGFDWCAIRRRKWRFVGQRGEMIIKRKCRFGRKLNDKFPVKKVCGRIRWAPKRFVKLMISNSCCYVRKWIRNALTVI